MPTKDPEMPLLDSKDPRMDPVEVRMQLQRDNKMAVGLLVKSALEHASKGVTQTDEKILQAWQLLQDKEQMQKNRAAIRQIGEDAKQWAKNNPGTAFLMIVGLGGTIFKAKTIGALMKGQAQGFIDWSKDPSTTHAMRFAGFCGVMVIRLFVSTLVPPTSPAFSVILQAATPESAKWTSMPFFLLSAAVAGIVPYLFDKLLQICFRRDFVYTELAKKFTDVWPLTCWTFPVMMKAFKNFNGDYEGAAVAVIFAHAAPFMGAQTTQIQRYFLPNPFDVVISQPFGMSEDLITMALAESASNATLASCYLTVLFSLFNLCYFALQQEEQKSTSLLGLLCFLLNLIAGGVVAAIMLYYQLSTKQGLKLVLLQFVIQLLIVPFVIGLVHRPIAKKHQEVLDENEDLKEDKEVLEGKNNELEETRRQLESDIRSLQAAKEREHKQVTDAQKEKSRLQEEVAQKQADLDTMQREINKIQQDEEKLASKVRQRGAEAAQAQELEAQHKKEKEQLKKDMGALQGRMRQLQESKDLLEKSGNVALGQKEQLEHDNIALQSNIEKLKEQMAKAQEHAQQDHANLEQQIHMLLEQVRGLQGENANLKKAAASAAAAGANQDTRQEMHRMGFRQAGPGQR